ncbi:MAG: hypothetical protein O2910_06570 [Proteobacteria bacterium]|nr:hypothetical protein [Pseudomonadota bacterium]
MRMLWGAFRRIAKIDEYSAASRSPTGFNVTYTVPHHKAFVQIELVIARRIFQHSGGGFAALTRITRDMRAKLNTVYWRLGTQLFMHRINFFTHHQPSPNVWLIGHYHYHKSVLLEPAHSFWYIFVEPKIRDTARCKRATITELRDG